MTNVTLKKTNAEVYLVPVTETEQPTRRFPILAEIMTLPVLLPFYNLSCGNVYGICLLRLREQRKTHYHLTLGVKGSRLYTKELQS